MICKFNDFNRMIIIETTYCLVMLSSVVLVTNGVTWVLPNFSSMYIKS